MRTIAVTAVFMIGFSAFAQDVVLPDGKAKATVESACSECHGLDQVVQSGMSAADWKATVNRMVKKGANVTPEQIDVVADYLAVYFPAEKTNVNTATADQLKNALQLTAAEAEAIVSFRKANGNFKDLAALEKVTGVDPKKIEAKKDLIAF
ncbi:MAG TPA: helix-hairpin-helix domain-containing protein [Bryobacteraceae bacterium]|nr:helix-hairpin-helix domain-containing protein [Bryobacteraceae bacterium]